MLPESRSRVASRYGTLELDGVEPQRSLRPAPSGLPPGRALGRRADRRPVRQRRQGNVSAYLAEL